MEHEVYVYLFRGAERLLVVLFGGASIWMGWDLFKRNIINYGDGKAEMGSWKIELKQVGPGVFFAVFGAVLLYGSWLSPITPSTTTSVPGGPAQPQNTAPAFLGNINKDMAKVFSKTVNTLNAEVDKVCEKDPGCSLKTHLGMISTFRNNEILPGLFDEKVILAARTNVSPENAPKDIQSDLEEYYKWITDTL